MTMIHSRFPLLLRMVTIILVLNILTGLAFSVPKEPENAVNIVEAIEVKILTMSNPPAKVLRRMSESVKTIGEHLLLGRSVIEVSSRRDYYERLVRDVFDRVLVGYTVENVEINPDSAVKINLSITPWGDTVQNISMQIDYSGIAPEAVVLVKQDMGKLEAEIQGALIGLPIDAVDWASGVARELIREILRRQLPEFHFSLDVEAGKNTAVRLSLFPTGPIVREAKVSLRSQSIPNLMIVHARPAIEAQVRTMRGLPIAYVERRLSYFKEQVRNAALADPLIRQFSLNVLPNLSIGTDTEVLVNVETERIRMSAEVFMDTGKERDNISAKAHVGKRIGKQDEVFIEVNVLPGMMTWEFMPGWGHQFGSDTWAGVRYRTNDKEWVGWLEQGLGGRWLLRVERWPGLDRNEIGLRYKLHDFLSAEFVLTNDRSWLRMVGHL